MYSVRSFIIAGLLAPLPFGASSPLALPPLLETAPDLPYTWEYKGCFIDRVGNRALKRAATVDGEMTGGWCARWCAERGYNLAGTEWGSECYCGYEINRPVLTRDADCSFPCAGWPTEACGGSQRITIYETLSGDPPSTFPGTVGFPSLGCYSDSVAKRALPIKATYTGGLDVAKCISTCSSQGYSLAGVEYGIECYCGNALDATSKFITGDGSASGCDYTCSGAPYEFCGGSNRMNLYGTFPAVVPTLLPAPSTSSPTPTSTPSSTSVASSTAEVTPEPSFTATPTVEAASSTIPAVDSPPVEVPTSGTPAPMDPSSTLIIDESSSSTTSAVVPVAEAAPTGAFDSSIS